MQTFSVFDVIWILNLLLVVLCVVGLCVAWDRNRCRQQWFKKTFLGYFEDCCLMLLSIISVICQMLSFIEVFTLVFLNLLAVLTMRHHVTFNLILLS